MIVLFWETKVSLEIVLLPNLALLINLGGFFLLKEFTGFYAEI